MKADDNISQLEEGEISYKIIGLLYKVHNKLGPLQKEVYYQRAIAKELSSNAIDFRQEYPVKVMYENNKVGEYRIDFLIDNKLILETKSANRIHPQFINQVLSYLNQLQVRVGLIANFKKDKLWIKRVLLPRKYLLKSALHPLTSEKADRKVQIL